MKTIINGKVYDTEDSDFFGRRTNGMCDEHPEWCSETLYHNITVGFFLYAVGNYRSKYAKKFSDSWNDSWSAGKQIIPLSYDAAFEWAEKNLTA